jgi:hypothetical protein
VLGGSSCGVVFVIVVVVVVVVVVFVELSGALKKEMRKWLNQISSATCTSLYFTSSYNSPGLLFWGLIDNE